MGKTIFTNEHKLPEVFVQACKVDRHVTHGDISVTQLIDSPQVWLLKQNNDLKVDVMERIDMLFGTAIHHVLERAEVKHFSARQLMDAANVLGDLGREKGAENLRALAKEFFPDAFDSNNLIERTLTLEIDGFTISGTIDRYLGEKKRLEDYKSASVWKYIYEEEKKKWYAQQNVYAAMLRENGYEVNEAGITALFKDWSHMAQVRQKDYPPQKVMTIPIKLLPHDDVMAYIKSRVAKHKSAREGNAVLCTPKERWSTADSFAIYSKSNKGVLSKRALKVLPEKPMADKWIEDNTLKYGSMIIQERPGEQKRCDKFCPVRDVCPQIKAINELRQNVESPNLDE